MPDDFQPPQCFECRDDLDFDEEKQMYYCEECDSTVSKADYEKQQEAEWANRIEWDKKHHPEWFKEDGQ